METVIKKTISFDSKHIYYSINAAKIFFIYLIVVWHSRLLDGIVNHGYIGVEFFFIMSGFFLRKSFRNSDKNMLSYARRRIRKLYPHYILSFAIMLGVSVLTGVYVKESYNCVAEVFMLQNLGFTRGGVNYPCWYLSVLFWGSLLLFGCMKYLGRPINTAILTMLPIFYYGYSIIFEDGRAEIWNTAHGVYLPLIRGLADLSLGIILYNIYEILQRKKLYRFKMAVCVTEIVSFLLVIALIVCPLNLDVVTVLMISIFILATLNEQSILECIGRFRIVQWISQYEYAIFLNHAVIVMLFRKYIIGVIEWRVSIILLLLLGVVTIYSVLTTEIIRRSRI